jgi:hypothetical protein
VQDLPGARDGDGLPGIAVDDFVIGHRQMQDPLRGNPNFQAELKRVNLKVMADKARASPC